MKEKKTGRRKWLRYGILGLLLILAAVLAVAVVLHMRGSSALHFLRKDPDGADTYYYESGVAFGEMEGNLAALSGTGLQILGSDGEEKHLVNVNFRTPAIAVSGKWAVAYDVGGTDFMVLDDENMVWQRQSEGRILSADINEKGYTVVSCEDSVYNSIVTVYNKTGGTVYQWYSGTGYVLDTALSPDGKELAVLTLTSGGSRVVFLRTDSEEVQAQWELGGKVLLDLCFRKEGVISALSGETLYTLGTDGSEKGVYSFAGQYLLAYSMAPGLDTALCLSPYQTGTETKTVLVDPAGSEKGAVSVEDGCVAVDTGDGCVAVLYTGSAVIYSGDTMTETAVQQPVTGARDILLRQDGSALVLYAYTAQALR